MIDDQHERTADTTDPRSRTRGDNDSRLLPDVTRSAATSVACGCAMTHAIAERTALACNEND